MRDVVIPYQWDALNDRIDEADPSHAIENFRIAAGVSKANFTVWFFRTVTVAKWLEAVAWSLCQKPDSELEKTADEVIELVADAQCEDGYLNTLLHGQSSSATLDESRRVPRALLCRAHD
ncbi:Uncharacterized protein conserved in bacteria [Raoultella planticola]|uniref:Uncharacterized protein conserved in bacteria n=1 Tax=Raoultella planticola TaxID=575 RepID=A0A485B9W8_RAOPL|nr:Uncharacterized protein conserved in bacteria [Raoultella planticola]